MSFFEPPPNSSQENHWEGPPDGFVGVVLPIGRALGRGREAAAVLDYVRVFREGFVITLALLGKPGTTSRPPFMMQRPGEPPSMPRVGVQFADGRRGGQRYRGPLGGRPFPGPGEAEAGDEPVVRAVGGGMGGPRGVFSMAFWVSPLPPPGELRVFLEWSAQGIPETSMPLSGDDIRRAAEESSPVWE